MLLLYAENFRRQFWEKYPQRKPPILAIQNECGVQKFVSTTIRSTPLIFADMIGNWKENASFVADFIEYEPLEPPTSMPSRLISPDVLLKRRKGNSFEIATLLCSLLIGAGFAAYVVAGYATREVSKNDQRRVVCPNIPKDVKEIDDVNENSLTMIPDLKSNFLIEKERMELEKEMRKQKRIDDEVDGRRKELEKLPPDNYYGRRFHAWVAVKEKKKLLEPPPKKDEDSESKKGEPLTEPQSDAVPETISSVFFIEPSTGFRFESDEPTYIAIESVWNHKNYYINRQEPITDISNMSWDFTDLNCWERFLHDDDVGEDTSEEPDDSSNGKYLDMPFSWVKQLHLSNSEFEERYPKGEKCIDYMRTRYERFAPFKNKNGLMTRLTTFETLDYEKPLLRWEWYENRSDLLYLIKINYETSEIEENFIKGRCDSLKYYTYDTEEKNHKILEFYHTTRADSLMKLEVHNDYIRQNFHLRRNCLYFREFKVELKSVRGTQIKSLVEITEKYNRNKNKKFNEDVAVRHVTDAEIFIQFQYATDAITATTRRFIKPPKPDYGCEYAFDMSYTDGYNSSCVEKDPSQVEMYLLFLDELREEDRCRKDYVRVCNDIDELMNVRRNELNNPQLKFSIFDPLRNEAARRLRMAKYDMLKEQHELAMRSDPDYVAPYLIIYGKNEPLNDEISEIIFHECLDEFKSKFTDIQMELEEKLNECERESKQFKAFFAKYEHQFNDDDFERFTTEGENIEINKAVIAHRLKDITDQFEKKYENVKMKILNDLRLTFRPDFYSSQANA